MKRFFANIPATWDLAFNAPPRRTRIFRRLGLGFYLLLLGVQITFTILPIISGEVVSGLISLFGALFILAVTCLLVVSWAQSTARDLIPDDIDSDIIPIVPSQDAPNPAVYGMMRAMETGEPIHMEKRDGVWYENGKRLPNMKGWD